MQKFSNRLIALRKERGLTQEALAVLIHKKRSTISGYETEGKEPDINTLCYMARYFGVSTDFLLGNSDERNNVDTIFYNDKVHFEQHLEKIPFELRSIVAACFNSFYLLLDKDIQLTEPEHLRLYQKLLSAFQSFRIDIRRQAELTSRAISNPEQLSEALPNLLARQNQMKYELATLLDQLMKADIEWMFRSQEHT